MEEPTTSSEKDILWIQQETMADMTVLKKDGCESEVDILLKIKRPWFVIVRTTETKTIWKTDVI